MKTEEFLNHLYTQVWKFIIEKKDFEEYWRTTEEPEYDPGDFYSDIIPVLITNLKEEFPLQQAYKEVIGKININVRPMIIKFMSWIRNIENLSGNDIFNKINNNSFSTKQLDDFAKFVEGIQLTEKVDTKRKNSDQIDMIFTVIDKFSTAAKPLLIRRKNKPRIKFNDEYDIQDVLHTILKPFFPSIKSEEVVSGGSKRFLKIDFLITSEKIGIECKFVKSNLKIDKIKAQINDDIQTYHQHQDCSTLIFFLYDKNQIIVDPDSLEKEYTALQKFNKKPMQIYLRVRPKN